MRSSRFAMLGLLVLTLAAAGCGAQATQGVTEDPAAVEPIKGTDSSRVLLSADAARRLQIRTALVRGSGGGDAITIPYAAVQYDPDGATWTYTSPEPRVFVRADITVERIDGGRATLSDGPPVGTRVVTVGAQEIWGVEYGEIEED